MTTGWFVEAGIWGRLAKALDEGRSPTAEQYAEYEAMYGSQASADGPRILSIAGSSAEIHITGVLTKAPSWIAAFFGGGNTTYSDIKSALAIADRDDNVEDITMVINSGGGQTSGLFDTLAAIENTSKPVKAVVDDMAASAAYAIASQADEIVANNKATMVGSIGIRQDHFVSEDVVTITSSNAPNKAPDVTTEEGKAAVRAELDDIEEIFIDSIAQGRGTTSKKVIADFGRGGVLLAGEALKRGMIDSVAGSSSSLSGNTDSETTSRSGEVKTEANIMDLKDLKAKHPDLYQAAKADGVKDGVNQERDRVGAHIEMGTGSGDMKTALAAIADGSEMTQTLMAKYNTAGMNRNDKTDRTEDDAEAAAAADQVSTADKEEAEGKRKMGVFAKAGESLGVKVEEASHA